MVACLLKFVAASAIGFVLLLCACLPCRAFSSSQFTDSGRSQEEEKAARKFDEFLELHGECDLGARLDNLAIQLQAEPESRAFIIVYNGKYDVPASVASYRQHIVSYLVNSRGIDAERLAILEGGYRQVLTTELWIAPKGAPAPEPTDTINAKQDLDKAFKFDEEQIYLPDNSPQFEEPVVEEAGTIEAAEAATIAEEAVAEQPVEAQEETTTAAQAHSEESVDATTEEPENEEELAVWWASQDYARALEMEAKARGLIIFYADRGQADFSRVKDVVERARTRLVGKYGVKAERLTLLFGGYRQSSEVELWLVPANAALPLPTPDPESQEKTVGQAK